MCAVNKPSAKTINVDWILVFKSFRLSLPIIVRPMPCNPAMSMCSLEKRVQDAVERWTVFRLLESHVDTAMLVRFKESVYHSLLLCSKQLPVDRVGSLDTLATDIHDLLEDANVDVDICSCKRMASILTDIYTEFAEGRSDFYQRLVLARPVECEYESSE